MTDNPRPEVTTILFTDLVSSRNPLLTNLTARNTQKRWTVSGLEREWRSLGRHRGGLWGIEKSAYPP
jgi:hypothetical protein